MNNLNFIQIFDPLIPVLLQSLSENKDFEQASF